MPHTHTPTPCRTEPRLFIAPDGQREDSPAGRARIAAAKELCRTCPIRTACRDEARTLGAEGIWGGEDDRERRRAGFAPKRASVARIAACGTEAGARRHRREGELPCPNCLAAETQANAVRKAARAEERPPTMPACGPWILRLMAGGLGSYRIANELGVSRRTVYSHQQRMRRALGLDTTEQLLDAAIAAVANGHLATSAPAEAQVA